MRRLLNVSGGGRETGTPSAPFRLLAVLSFVGDLSFAAALAAARAIGGLLHVVYRGVGRLGLAAPVAMGVEDASERRGRRHRADAGSHGLFDFDWGVAAQFLLLLLTLMPFAVVGRASWSIPCLGYVAAYVALLRRDRARVVRDANLEALDRRFPSPLLGTLGLCYTAVATSLALAAHRLRGPPLCFARCATCLRRWHAVEWLPDDDDPLGEGIGLYNGAWDGEEEGRAWEAPDPKVRCGAANGAELLGVFGVAQSGACIFLSASLVIIVCLAWSLSGFEKTKRREAEKWLKSENCVAYALREELCLKAGPPGADARISLDRDWMAAGLGFALAFSTLGLKRWRDLDYARPWSAAYVALHICIAFASFLVVHVGFFGRLRDLYLRSLRRVKLLTEQLSEILKNAEDEALGMEEGRDSEGEEKDQWNWARGSPVPEAHMIERFLVGHSPRSRHSQGFFEGSGDEAINANVQVTARPVEPERVVLCVEEQTVGNSRRLEAWWTERLFVFVTDMSLDYSMAGLGMSTTFFLVLLLLVLVAAQISQEGLAGALGPPASYCLCGIGYMVFAMWRMLDIAKDTYLEQQNHGEHLSRYRALLREHSPDGDYVDSMLVQIRACDPLPTVMGFPIRPKGHGP